MRERRLPGTSWRRFIAPIISGGSAPITTGSVSVEGACVGEQIALSAIESYRSLCVSEREEVARYPYIDPETGEILAFKVRYEPKSFEWYAADSDQPGGVVERDLPLYNAHKLPKDLRKAVFFVEGEKAADALSKKMQVPAVCLPGGAATRPTTKQLSVLRGRR